MINERGPRHLRAADGEDPIWRLWQALPPQWRGPVLGEGISNWAAITENGWRRLDLSHCAFLWPPVLARD